MSGPKIFIYEVADAVRIVHADYARHRLAPYLEYLKRLTLYFRRFETKDPDEADFFFVPISLISFQFHGEGMRYSDPWPHLETLPYLGHKPHILFAAGDYGQRKHASYETTVLGRPYPEIYPWLDGRFILLAFESNGELSTRDIAILPYVLEPQQWLERLRRKLIMSQVRRRDLLYSFVGRVGYRELAPEHIRGTQLRQLEGITADTFVGSLPRARQEYGSWRGSDIGMLCRSIFTLCPAGFGRWSFRFAQAFRYGSIAVLLADGYVKPFSEYIPWEQFCLTVPEADLRTVPDRLRALPDQAIVDYQLAIADAAPLLTEESIHRMVIVELAKRAELLA